MIAKIHQPAVSVVVADDVWLLQPFTLPEVKSKLYSGYRHGCPLPKQKSLVRRFVCVQLIIVRRESAWPTLRNCSINSNTTVGSHFKSLDLVFINLTFQIH